MSWAPRGWSRTARSRSGSSPTRSPGRWASTSRRAVLGQARGEAVRARARPASPATRSSTPSAPPRTRASGLMAARLDRNALTSPDPARRWRDGRGHCGVPSTAARAWPIRPWTPSLLRGGADRRRPRSCWPPLVQATERRLRRPSAAPASSWRAAALAAQAHLAAASWSVHGARPRGLATFLATCVRAGAVRRGPRNKERDHVTSFSDPFPRAVEATSEGALPIVRSTAARARAPCPPAADIATAPSPLEVTLGVLDGRWKPLLDLAALLGRAPVLRAHAPHARHDQEAPAPGARGHGEARARAQDRLRRTATARPATA